MAVFYAIAMENVVQRYETFFVSEIFVNAKNELFLKTQWEIIA